LYTHVTEIKFIIIIIIIKDVFDFIRVSNNIGQGELMGYM